jgi:hypothetical protein
LSSFLPEAPIVLRALSADIFAPASRKHKGRFADRADADPDGYGYRPHMHADERTADIDPEIGRNRLNENRLRHRRVCRFGKRPAGIAPGHGVDPLETVHSHGLFFHYERTVQVFAALNRKKYILIRTKSRKHRVDGLRGLHASRRADFFADNLARAAADHEDASFFRARERVQFVKGCTQIFHDTVKHAYFSSFSLINAN